MLIESILFDLDDTLHDRNRALYMFIGQFIEHFSDAMDFDNSKLRDAFLEIDCKGYKPRKEMFRELQNLISWRIKPEVQELIDFWDMEFPKCAKPMTDLYRMLDFFLDKKIKMGIVTNGDSGFQNTKIEKLNLRQYMHTIIISEEVGIRKPDPEIFLLALSKMHSKPQTTLYVGDNPSTDIKGSSQAGLIPVWLNGGGIWCETDFVPMFSINNLCDLADLFDATDKTRKLDGVG